jgi:hypothetical protein
MIYPGTYTNEKSDLFVHIHRVTYRDVNNRYIKVKLSLSNKHNGIVYELNQNYKLYLDNIKHWSKHNE